MTESELYEKIGRQHALIERQDAAYTQLLHVLAQVVSGATDRARLLVNLTDRTWQVGPDGFRPELPATINGLPVCVTAPEPPEPQPCCGHPEAFSSN